MLRHLALFALLSTGCQVLYPHTLREPLEVKIEEDLAEADYLGQAAQCMEKGDQAGAVPLMLKQIEAHPDQIMIRAYLAELLVRLKKNPEAKEQFEAFISEAQQTEGPAKKHLVHCHTRLMEIAQECNDDFTEKLHRGIGLYLLAKQHALIDENEDPGQTQQLIFKAIHELEAAQKMHREDARPSWYLYECWTMLNQPRPAEKALHEAQVNAPFSKLTPGENRELRFARRSMEGK